jgi:hypothetical protein
VIEDVGVPYPGSGRSESRPALWDELAREHAEARTRSLRARRLFDWSVLKVRPVAVVMAGDTVDVSCVVFHDECPGLGAMLCGSELFVVIVVVVVVRSEGCMFRSRRGDHVGVTNMGEVLMGGYLPHIVNSYFVALHCTLLSQ